MIEVPEGQAWIIDMVNNILLEVLSSIAEEERETIKRRQREGIEVAKKNGKHLGRPPLEYPEHWERYYKKWREGEITATQMMKILGVKKTSFTNWFICIKNRNNFTIPLSPNPFYYGIVIKNIDF